MRPVLLLLLPVLFATACSPDLGVQAGQTFHPPLSARSECVVLGVSDTIRIKGDTVGKFSYDQTISSIPWDDMQITRYFQSEALYNGGNLVKITKNELEGTQNKKSVVALVYHVDDIRHYEKEIEWSVDRKLRLSDFKGPPDRPAVGQPGLHSYSGCDFYLFSKAKFWCYYSWIDPASGDSLKLLAHEQGNFDLSEVYRRQLDEYVLHYEHKEANQNKLTATIFRQVYASYIAKQAQYETATDHGLDPIRQAEWTKKIAAELANTRGTHDPLFVVDQLFTQRQKDSAISTLTPAPGKALVYIIRPKSISTPMPERIVYNPFPLWVCAYYMYFINPNQYTIDYKDSTTLPIKGGTYIHRSLDPDRYSFTAIMNKGFPHNRGVFGGGRPVKTGLQMKCSLAAGKIYYLKMTTRATWFGYAKPQLQLLNEEEGRTLLRKCSGVVASDDVELPELYDPLE